MNRIVFYRIAILILIVSSLHSAELLKPAFGGVEKEILNVGGKRRIYTVLAEEPVVYQVKGPTRIEFITRYPSPKRTKKNQSFAYSIVIDNEEPIKVHHKYKVQKSIRSVQHPNHYYTYSGNYFINIGKGEHTLTFARDEDQKYPVLLRVIKKDFETTVKGKRELQPMVYQSNRIVQVDGKEVSYYEMVNGRPLQVEIIGPKTLQILSRLIFDSKMGDEDQYRIRVKSGQKVLGTYFMNTERSSVSSIMDMPESVPGKWRTCEIQLPKGKQVISMELVDKNKRVLARFQEYK